MAAVDLGDSVTVTWPGSPAGTIAATVTQADGTAFGGSVTVAQSSPATASFVPVMAGRHLVKFTSTGAGSLTQAYQDLVDVWPVDQRFIISLQDAQDGLSWPNSGFNPANQNDLRLFVAAATPVIEDIVGGPVLYGQYVVKIDGGKPSVVLPGTVQSIVSVTENGYPVTTYVYDETSNTLTAGTMWAPRRFMPTVRGIVVTYMGGFQVIPPNIILGTRELVRFWWQVGKQGVRPGGGNLPVTADAVTAGAFTPSGFAVPRRVMELCSPARHNLPAGFA